jgi:hypothetical protein
MYNHFVLCPALSSAISQGKRGAVGRVSDCSPEGGRFKPLMVFLPLPQNSIWLKSKAALQNTLPG